MLKRHESSPVTEEIYAFGYNGFGQLSTSQSRKILHPTHLLQTKLNKLQATWSSIIWMEDETIHICGLFGENPSSHKSFIVDVNSEEMKCSCYHRNTLFVLTYKKKLYFFNNLTSHENKGKLTPDRVEENVLEFVLKESVNQLSVMYECGSVKEFKFAEDSLQLEKNFSCPIKVKQLSCGNNHNLLLSTEGQVFSWGMGSRGQLGHGDLIAQENPKLIEILDMIRVISIACGGWHSLALSDTHDIYTWGWNCSGQTGLPAPNGVFSTSVNRKEDGESCGVVPSPTLLQLEKYCPHREDNSFISITSIACGARHSAAATSDGCLFTWGWAEHGQLAQGCCLAASCDVSDSHLPAIVSWFGNENLKVVMVKCGWWNTLVSGEMSSVNTKRHKTKAEKT